LGRGTVRRGGCPANILGAVLAIQRSRAPTCGQRRNDRAVSDSRHGCHSERSLACPEERRACFGLTRGSCERETQRGICFRNRLYDCQRKGRDSSPPRTARAERGVCVPRMRNAFLLADGFRCLGGRSFSSDIERSGRSPALCAVFLAACAALAVAGSHADLFMFQFNFDL
jgi:hypothetical protein